MTLSFYARYLRLSSCVKYWTCVTVEPLWSSTIGNLIRSHMSQASTSSCFRQHYLFRKIQINTIITKQFLSSLTTKISYSISELMAQSIRASPPGLCRAERSRFTSRSLTYTLLLYFNPIIILNLVLDNNPPHKTLANGDGHIKEKRLTTFKTQLLFISRIICLHGNVTYEGRCCY